MTSLEPNLTAARRELICARDLALANAAEATYQVAHGHIRPLANCAGVVARLDDLIHLIDRLQTHA